MNTLARVSRAELAKPPNPHSPGVLLKSIRLRNILSFGPQSETIELGRLNVLIGPNGSGKSNLVECLDLLRAAPVKLGDPIRDGGGMAEWLHKGSVPGTSCRIEVVVDRPQSPQALRHVLELGLDGSRFEVGYESIAYEYPDDGQHNPYLFYELSDGQATLNKTNPRQKRGLHREFLSAEQSILNGLKDPDQYPEITYLGKLYTDEIGIYREWSMGRYSAPRLHQPADLPHDFLEEDFRNLGLVLNHLESEYPAVKDRIVELLRTLYPTITGISQRVVAGTVQVFAREGDKTIPATRLSDGTLRFLCLLAILLHPKPPRLLCIEEPEIGLHPDVIGTLAELLVEASERTQLIVTTHSVRLIDGLTDHPEAVLVCEKDEGGTSLTRLDGQVLAPWLKDFSLGRLWTKGELGGNRW